MGYTMVKVLGSFEQLYFKAEFGLSGAHPKKLRLEPFPGFIRHSKPSFILFLMGLYDGKGLETI